MKRMKKLAPLFVLALALCAMAANMLHWGSVKEGFHGDELYSYQFVCVPGYPSINAPRPGQPYLNAWHDASYFEDYLTVSEDEAFELGSVISNILPDDHPPLFYMLLKLACSLVSRGQFSKWPGILLNLALFLLTQIALFALSKRLFRSSWWAALVCAVYGMSIGAVNAVMYARMYVLLTLACTLFLGVHVRLWERYLRDPDGRLRQRIPAYAALLLSTALGILSHYYFLVFAFFMCALMWGWLLVTRRDRLAVEYAVAAGSGVAAAVLLWPNLIHDLLKGHRGVEAFNNFSSGSNWGGNIRTLLRIVNTHLFAGLFGILLAILVALLVFRALSGHFAARLDAEADGKCSLTVARKAAPPPDLQKRSFEFSAGWFPAIQALLASLLYIFVIARVAPYLTNRYIFNTFPLIVLFAVYVLRAAISGFRCRKLLTALAVCLIAAMTLLSYKTVGVGYLYLGTADKLETLDRYADRPAICVTYRNQRFTSCAECLNFSHSSRVYPTDEEGISTLSAARADADAPEWIVYIDKSYEDVSEILRRVAAAADASGEPQHLFDTSTCSVYLLPLGA